MGKERIERAEGEEVKKSDRHLPFGAFSAPVHNIPADGDVLRGRMKAMPNRLCASGAIMCQLPANQHKATSECERCEIRRWVEERIECR